VVPLTVVVVAPLVVVAPPVVVVPLTVVVVAPLVVVAPEVVVAPPVVVVPFTVVVVAPDVVVVPPVVVADASWPTLTPASTIKAIAMSQADVRLRTFFTCLAIDPYLLLSAATLLIARHVQDKQDSRLLPFWEGRTAQAECLPIWPWRLLSGRLKLWSVWAQRP
jgi:hypothetical protein